ncbi:DUF4124 domain-containing protein [Zestomonas thermotolerans]|uniref:DUF4124 domain-containing protein n=1 Tax=Zestomonas thermotolerans TaxID=157784 RepID=UPI00036469C5|nr:DUF4124 domain-containing protein [Pseudomonas thermotolerans]
MRLFAACLLLALALPAGAQIYKYTDAKGNTVFTDQPPQGVASESLDLPPANTVQMQAPPPAAKPQADGSATSAQSAAPYRVLRLINLPSEEALRANNGSFSVDVELQPALRSGHRLRLILDGKPYGEPSTVPRLQVVNADRGEHRLAVEVLSGDRPVQQSEVHTFTVQRVHTGSPALRSRP